MILFISAGFALAKLKGHKLKIAFKSFWLYPLFALELLYIFIQLGFITGNKELLIYAAYLQKAFILVLIPSVIRFSINLPAIFSTISVILGTAINKFVMHMNNGMPVFPSLSKLTGYYSDGIISAVDDGRHILGHSEVKFKFLADYIDVGFAIFSPGDIMIHSFVTVIVYYTIKSLNQAETPKETATV